MATLTETYTWDLFGAELKTALGIIVTDYDAKLAGWLAAAVRAGDSYLNHFWIKLDGRTPTHVDTIIGADVDEGGDIPHPADVVMGVTEWVRLAWQVYGGDENGGPRPFGLTSVRTGDLSEGYAVGSRMGGGEITPDMIHTAVKPLWRPYRRNRLQ